MTVGRYNLERYALHIAIGFQKNRRGQTVVFAIFQRCHDVVTALVVGTAEDAIVELSMRGLDGTDRDRMLRSDEITQVFAAQVELAAGCSRGRLQQLHASRAFVRLRLT